VVGTSSNLTIGVSNDHVGSYTCRASVMGILIEAETNIYLKGPPSITSTKKQFGIPGETVQIECVAFSIPKARHIQWSYNGREINSSQDGDYTILEQITTFGMKSTLVIRDSDSKHFGRYNCSVTNDYGHDNVEIALSGLRKFALRNSIKYLSVCVVGAICVVFSFFLRFIRHVFV
jgi:Immunoglobulin domain